MDIQIIRLETTDKVTRGVMLIDGVPKFATLEPPWKDNKRNVSCIPEGEYKLIPHNGLKYKDTFIIETVIGRGGIVCPHVGNTVSDTEGCVLIGMEFAEFGVAPAVSHSRTAMTKFREITDGQTEMSLEIWDAVEAHDV